jgi:hypothetical protein
MDNVTAAAAAEELLRRRAAREGLAAYIEYVSGLAPWAWQELYNVALLPGVVSCAVSGPVIDCGDAHAGVVGFVGSEGAERNQVR